MTSASRKAPAPPLGVIASLASGFEMVNARLELILLPLALDLFLWLGPHLSLQPMTEQFLDLLRRLPPPPDSLADQSLETWRQIAAYGARFFLFSMLSTAPLGLSSLVAGRAAVAAPMGAPITWFIDNPLEYLLLSGAFVLIGLFLGALYFGGIAQQVRDARLDLRRLLRQVWRDWATLTALAAVLIFALMVVGMPFLLVAGLVSLFSPWVGGFISLIGSTLALWVLFYAGFAPHGIILQRRGLFGALWDSLRLVHRNLPPTAGLYVIIILLNLGLGALWNIPEDDSWLLLIGLAGHALVSTALVAATFAYYQDRYRWWIEIRQTRQAQAAEQSGINRSTKA